MQAPAGAPWPRPSHDEDDEEHVSAGASSSTTVSELVAMRDAPQEVSLLLSSGAVQNMAGQARLSVCNLSQGCTGHSMCVDLMPWLTTLWMWEVL